MSVFLSHRLFPVSSTLLFCASLLSFSSVATLNAAAQDRYSSDNGVAERLDYLEHRLNEMNTRPSSGGRGPAPAGAAGLEVRITQMEEELRTLNGRLEELDHQQRRVNEQFELLQKDNEARMSAMDARLPAAAPPVIGGSAPASPAPAPETPQQPSRYSTEPAPAIAPVETHGEATPAPTQTQAPQSRNNSQYGNAREHYDAAFKSLNQSDYPRASQLFSSFIAQYPKDVLIGNAYYWLGETYYVQRQYAPAAEQFRLGFENMPEGPKAPDNLLKLGMSLNLLNRNKEACVVLGQLLKKYNGQSEVIERKAKMESARLQCGA